MAITAPPKLPALSVTLDVDVRSLFQLKPEFAPKPHAPSVAELAQEVVQCELKKLGTLHGPAQEIARRHFIDALQVYNTSVDTHQSSQIAALDNPFISTPELIQQSLVIQTAMQRDIIVNARDQARKLVAEAESLWGTSQENKAELWNQFSGMASDLSEALVLFDAHLPNYALTAYRQIVSQNEDYVDWIARDLHRSEQLKHGTVKSLIAAATVVATIATEGGAMLALGKEGVAALSAGARIGMFVGNGAILIPTQRALEEKILHIPFWRKEGAAANAIDISTDIFRVALFMGSAKAAGDIAAAALPIATTEPALISLRNLGAEISGFNTSDVALGRNPREIFTLNHQLDQFSLLLGIRAANGIVGSAPVIMRSAANMISRAVEALAPARLATARWASVILFGIPAATPALAQERPMEPQPDATLQNYHQALSSWRHNLYNIWTIFKGLGEAKNHKDKGDDALELLKALRDIESKIETLPPQASTEVAALRQLANETARDFSDYWWTSYLDQSRSHPPKPNDFMMFIAGSRFSLSHNRLTMAVQNHYSYTRVALWVGDTFGQSSAKLYVNPRLRLLAPAFDILLPRLNNPAANTDFIPSEADATENVGTKLPVRLANIPFQNIDRARFNPEPNNVLTQLYTESQSKDAHHEGIEAIAEIFRQIKEFAAQGIDRVSEPEMTERVLSVMQLSEQIFARVPMVEAVVWMGSSLRGKPNSNDVDLWLLGPYARPIHDPFDPAALNRVQVEMAHHYAKTKLPNSLFGLPIQLIVNSHFEGRTGAYYLNRGPYLTFVRPSAPDATTVFGNWSGELYLQDRKP